MTYEFIILLSCLISGSIAVRFVGFKGWALPVFGFLVGISLLIIIGFLLLVSSLPNFSFLLVSTMVILTLFLIGLSYKRGLDLSLRITEILMIVGLFCALIILFNKANLVKWTSDSIEYLQLSSLLASGDYDLVPPTRMTQLPLALPIIHSPVNTEDISYFHAINPLLGICLLLAFSWFVIESAKRHIGKSQAIIYAVTGSLLILSFNRFVFSSFYINNHILFAALLLVVSGSCWLLNMQSSSLSNKSLIILQISVIPAMVFSRPEAPLIILFALLPTILNRKLSWIIRYLPATVLALASLVWQVFLAFQHVRINTEIPISIWSSLIFALLILTFSFLQRRDFIKLNAKLLLNIAEFSLWTAIAWFSIFRFDIVSMAIDSTVNNLVLGAGSWGGSLILVSVIIISLLVSKKTSGLIALRFPITTFVPLMFLVRFIIGSGYRIGNGDSLNRAVIHIVPILVLYLTAIVIFGKDRQWFRNLKTYFNSLRASLNV